MHNKIIILLLIFSSFSAFSCKKGSGSIPDFNNKKDSATLLAVRWSLAKDSVTNIGDYFFDGGYPIPGVYNGAPGDFYDFKIDGTLSIYENSFPFTTSYKLCTNNKLLLYAMALPDTNNVLALTSSSFIFELTATSSNGGKYYKRVYLYR